MNFDSSDEELARLKPLMPKSRGSPRVDDRKITNAIFSLLRPGMASTNCHSIAAFRKRIIASTVGPDGWLLEKAFRRSGRQKHDSLYLIDSTVVEVIARPTVHLT